MSRAMQALCCPDKFQPFMVQFCCADQDLVNFNLYAKDNLMLSAICFAAGACLLAVELGQCYLPAQVCESA